VSRAHDYKPKLKDTAPLEPVHCIGTHTRHEFSQLHLQYVSETALGLQNALPLTTV